MSDTLDRLEKWYRNRCDGEWEHQWGVRIDTLDNPGWTVTIDLGGTDLAGQAWPELRVDRSSTDWIRCWIEGSQFRGCGDPGKLEQILNYFLERAERGERGCGVEPA